MTAPAESPVAARGLPIPAANEAMRRTFLEERQRYLGGSDIAAIVGLSKYKTKAGVWLDKTTPLTEDRINEDSEILEWGRRLEEPVCRAYADKMGVRLLSVPSVVHVNYPWARASYDRLVLKDEYSPKPDWGFEAKTSQDGSGWGSGYCRGCSNGKPCPNPTETNGGVPPEYVCQCQWYLWISGMTRWDISVYIGGHTDKKFRTYHIFADKQFQEHLRDEGEKFWNEHVVTGIPPPPDASEESGKILMQKYPEPRRPIIRANAEFDSLADRFRKAQVAFDKAKNELELVKNTLRDRIGDASGVQGQGYKFTWGYSQGRTMVDWEGIAADLAKAAGIEIPPDVVQKHTRQSQGSRPLRPSFNK